MQTFAYERPRSLDAAAALLAEAGAGAAVLAGGTDLITQLRSRLLRPSLVLDIKGIDELHRLEAGEELSLGAAVSFNRVIEELDRGGPFCALVQAAGLVASYPIRNRATVVGNVANASPCADSVPVLCVLDGEVEVVGGPETRRIPVREFIVGNRETRLLPGELVSRLVVPRPGQGARSAFLKTKRVKGHDLALANAALLRDPERGRLRLSVGSCTPAPTLLVLDEMAARPDVEEAATRAQAAIKPINDVRASVEYRRDMVGVMVRRLFQQLLQSESRM